MIRGINSDEEISCVRDAETRSGEVWYSGSFVEHGGCKDDILQYMTTMGVQGRPMLLDKNVSAGDDCWDLRWEEIPEALRCMEIFGTVS